MWSLWQPAMRNRRRGKCAAVALLAVFVISWRKKTYPLASDSFLWSAPDIFPRCWSSPPQRCVGLLCAAAERGVKWIATKGNFKSPRAPILRYIVIAQLWMARLFACDGRASAIPQISEDDTRNFSALESRGWDYYSWLLTRRKMSVASGWLSFIKNNLSPHGRSSGRKSTSAPAVSLLMGLFLFILISGANQRGASQVKTESMLKFITPISMYSRLLVVVCVFFSSLIQIAMPESRFFN